MRVLSVFNTLAYLYILTPNVDTLQQRKGNGI